MPTGSWSFTSPFTPSYSRPADPPASRQRTRQKVTNHSDDEEEASDEEHGEDDKEWKPGKKTRIVGQSKSDVVLRSG